MSEPHAASPAPRRAHVWVGRALVLGQFALIGALVLTPGADAWPTPGWLDLVCRVLVGIGLVVMVVGGTSLGRGLTATPLPNVHAQLRTGGLYRYVRHPIYSGLLLVAVAITAPSGSVGRLVVLALLVALLTVKARWEEARLTERFDGYAAYAARTGRFVPRPSVFRRVA